MARAAGGGTGGAMCLKLGVRVADSASGSTSGATDTEALAVTQELAWAGLKASVQAAS